MIWFLLYSFVCCCFFCWYYVYIVCNNIMLYLFWITINDYIPKKEKKEKKSGLKVLSLNVQEFNWNAGLNAGFFLGKKKCCVFIRHLFPHFYCCSMVWHFPSNQDSDKLDHLNKRILRFIFKGYNSDYNNLLKKAGTANQIRTSVYKTWLLLFLNVFIFLIIQDIWKTCFAYALAPIL